MRCQLSRRIPSTRCPRGESTNVLLLSVGTVFLAKPRRGKTQQCGTEFNVESQLALPRGHRLPPRPAPGVVTGAGVSCRRPRGRGAAGGPPRPALPDKAGTKGDWSESGSLSGTPRTLLV